MAHQTLSEMLSMLPARAQDDPMVRWFTKMVLRWRQQGDSLASHHWTLLILYRRLLRQMLVERDRIEQTFRYVQRQVDRQNTERFQLDEGLTTDRDLMLDLMQQQALLEQFTFLLCWGGHLVHYLTTQWPVAPADYPRIAGLFNVKVSRLVAKINEIAHLGIGRPKHCTVHDLIVHQIEDLRRGSARKPEGWRAPFFEAHQLFSRVSALPPEAQSMVDDGRRLIFVGVCISTLAELKRDGQEQLERYFPRRAKVRNQARVRRG